MPQDQPKTIEELLEKQNQNMNKNFDRLNEGITNLVKLISGGRLPTQPVHAVNGITQEQTSHEHINIVTALRSGTTLPKRGDDGPSLQNVRNTNDPGTPSVPLPDQSSDTYNRSGNSNRSIGTDPPIDRDVLTKDSNILPSTSNTPVTPKLVFDLKNKIRVSCKRKRRRE